MSFTLLTCFSGKLARFSQHIFLTFSYVFLFVCLLLFASVNFFTVVITP